MSGVSESYGYERVNRETDGNEMENVTKEEEQQVCEDTATGTEVDFKKMLAEIRHFKDHFAM